MRLAAALVLAATAAAHDLTLTAKSEGPAVIVTAAYAGTEACTFAAVTIFNPSGKEHQSGRSDASGRFAFVPNALGDWKVVIDDEIGHRQELKIVAGEAGTIAAGAQPLWQKAVTGLALIFGITGFLYGWKRRAAR
ncbi:MAG: hypothetical protein SFV18_05645 [Bryobacteraceae bacterium]|nr:hypothetical protein [Bryobacteraceae bacterium]